MKLKFICANHSHWLETHPKEALNCWANAMETGLYYQDQAMWQASIAPFGCAYEIAIVLLDQSELIDSEQILRFSDSAKRLIYSMIRAGKPELAAENIAGVQSFFNRISRRYFDRQQVLTMVRELRLIQLTEILPVESRSAQLGLPDNNPTAATRH